MGGSLGGACAVFAETPPLYAVFRGPEHELVEANEPWLDVLGMDQSAFGRPARELARLDTAFLDEVYATGTRHAERGVRRLPEVTGPLPEPTGQYHFSYEPMIDASGLVTGIVAIGVDLTCLLRAERLGEWHQRLLERITLDATLPEIFEDMAHLVVPALASACTIDVIDDATGRLERVVGLAPQELAKGPPQSDLDKVNQIARVLRSGQTEVSWREGGRVCMPLTARGAAFGVMTLLGTLDQPITQRAVELAQELVHAMLPGIENARRHRQRVGHLRSLEELTEQLALLNNVSTILTASLDVDEILKRLSQVIVPLLADWVTVILREGDEVRRVVVTHREGPGALPADWVGPIPPIPEYPLDPLARTLRRGVTAILGPDQIAATPHSALQAKQNELFRRLGAASVLMVPLQTPREVLGALTIVRTDPARPYDSADLHLASDIARRAALGVDNAKLYDQQRSIAQAMQHHLLSPLPHIDHLRLAARYRPAPQGSQVGGDWYDAFRLPDGSLAVAVGDVGGHDLQAAANMAQLRSNLRTLAWDHRESPGHIVGRLDSVMCHTSDTEIATVIFGRIQGGDDEPVRLCWTSAGHLPPLLIARGDGARYLEAGQDILLGLDTPPDARLDATEPLPPSSVLLFYTDGLVESVTSPLGGGLSRLLRHASSLNLLPIDELCDRLLTLIPDNSTDDIVLLAVEVLP